MQQLILNTLWLKNAIGISIAYKNLGRTTPITQYYFWPVTKAWEQIKFELESKDWIVESERIRLLNLIVETIDDWQKSHGTKKAKNIKSSSNTHITGYT